MSTASDSSGLEMNSLKLLAMVRLKKMMRSFLILVPYISISNISIINCSAIKQFQTFKSLHLIHIENKTAKVYIISQSGSHREFWLRNGIGKIYLKR